MSSGFHLCWLRPQPTGLPLGLRVSLGLPATAPPTPSVSATPCLSLSTRLWFTRPIGHHAWMSHGTLKSDTTPHPFVCTCSASGVPLSAPGVATCQAEPSQRPADLDTCSCSFCSASKSDPAPSASKPGLFRELPVHLAGVPTLSTALEWPRLPPPTCLSWGPWAGTTLRVPPLPPSLSPAPGLSLAPSTLSPRKAMVQGHGHPAPHAESGWRGPLLLGGALGHSGMGAARVYVILPELLTETSWHTSKGRYRWDAVGGVWRSPLPGHRCAHSPESQGTGTCLFA